MRVTVVPSSYHFSDYNRRELRHLCSFWHTERKMCAVAGGRGGSKVTGVVCLSSPFFTPFNAASAMVAGWDSAQHLQSKLPGAKPVLLLRPHLECFTAMVPTQCESDISIFHVCWLPLAMVQERTGVLVFYPRSISIFLCIGTSSCGPFIQGSLSENLRNKMDT